MNSTSLPSYGSPWSVRLTQEATSASGSVSGGARKPIGRPGMNGSPIGCPGPPDGRPGAVAGCAGGKMLLTNDAFSTPTGETLALLGVIPSARVSPLGA